MCGPGPFPLGPFPLCPAHAALLNSPLGCLIRPLNLTFPALSSPGSQTNQNSLLLPGCPHPPQWQPVPPGAWAGSFDILLYTHSLFL